MYETRAAAQFREWIRPSLVGIRQLGAFERNVAVDAANELGLWMTRLVMRVLAQSRLNERKGEVTKQLYAGIRIYGRASLASLRGQIRAYPWLMAHEYGASIAPTEGQYLTIPIFYGVRADGSPKFRNANSWRRFGSFVYTQKSTGRKFLAYKSKETGDLRILYILVEETEIKPVLNLVRNANMLLPQLVAAWGQIYIREIMKPQYKAIRPPWSDD